MSSDLITDTGHAHETAVACLDKVHVPSMLYSPFYKILLSKICVNEPTTNAQRRCVATIDDIPDDPEMEIDEETCTVPTEYLEKWLDETKAIAEFLFLMYLAKMKPSAALMKCTDVVFPEMPPATVDMLALLNANKTVPEIKAAITFVENPSLKLEAKDTPTITPFFFEMLTWFIAKSFTIKARQNPHSNECVQFLNALHYKELLPYIQTKFYGKNKCITLGEKLILAATNPTARKAAGLVNTINNDYLDIIRDGDDMLNQRYGFYRSEVAVAASGAPDSEALHVVEEQPTTTRDRDIQQVETLRNIINGAVSSYFATEALNENGSNVDAVQHDLQKTLAEIDELESYPDLQSIKSSAPDIQHKFIQVAETKAKVQIGIQLLEQIRTTQGVINEITDSPQTSETHANNTATYNLLRERLSSILKKGEDEGTLYTNIVENIVRTKAIPEPQLTAIDPIIYGIVLGAVKRLDALNAALNAVRPDADWTAGMESETDIAPEGGIPSLSSAECDGLIKQIEADHNLEKGRLSAEIRALENTIRRLTEEKEIREPQITELRDAVNKLTEENTNLKIHGDEATSEISTLKQELAACRDEVAEKEKALQEEQARDCVAPSSLELIQLELQQEKDKYTSLQRAHEDIRAQLTNAINESSAAKGDLSVAQTTIQQLQEKANQLDELQSTHQQLRERVAGLEAAEKACRERIAGLQQEHEATVTENTQQLTETIDQLRSRIEEQDRALAVAGERLAAANADKEKCDEEVARAKSACDASVAAEKEKLETAITDHKAALSSMQETCKQHLAQVADLSAQQQQTLMDKINMKEEELNQKQTLIQSKVTQLGSQIAALQQENSDKDKQNADLTEQLNLARSTATADVADLQRERDEISVAHQEKERQVNDLTEQLNLARSTASTATLHQEQLAQVQQERNEALAKSQEHENKVVALEQEKTAIEDTHQEQIAQLQKEKAAKESELANKSSIIADLQTAIRDCRAKTEALDERGGDDELAEKDNIIAKLRKAQKACEEKLTGADADAKRLQDLFDKGKDRLKDRKCGFTWGIKCLSC